MNKKVSLGITIGILCLAVALSSVITMTIVTKEYNSILKGLPGKIERFEVIDELDKIIGNNYYGNISDENLERAIAEGYISKLGDNYSKYLTGDEFADYVNETQGNMSGIGIEFTKGKKSYIEITDVYDGSPAEAAGLRTGDLIIAFDGIMINSANYSEMVAKLEGDKLTSVNLTYRSDGIDSTVNIVKGYEARSVTTGSHGTVGYLKITNFYPSTASQVDDAVKKLLTSGVSAIVIDVRKNTSTNLDVAMDVLDIFVPMNDNSVSAASVIYENGEIVLKYSTSSGEVNLPMAVLVSSKTSAAAELFAINMRDFGKAEIVGNTTAGKGLKRDVFTLENGDAVLLSVGVIKPYRSDYYNVVGITPDLESELTEKTNKIENDSQFLDAVNLIAPDSAQQ